MTDSATAEAGHAHPTLDEAAKNLRAARASVDTLTHSYQDIRHGSREGDIARARVQWGLALAIWVDALIAQEEARDREHIERRHRAWEQAMNAGPGDMRPGPSSGGGHSRGGLARCVTPCVRGSVGEAPSEPR